MSAVRQVTVFLGDVAERFEGRYYALDQHLREARIPQTYRTYMARTIAYSLLTLVAVPLFLLLFYVVSGVLLTRYLIIGTVIAGVVSGYVVHRIRVYYPKYIADVREQQIDTTLSGVTSFMFALVRGGMPLPEVLRTVSNHSDVFGEAAEELGVASRNIEYLGDDVVTALQDLSDTTPSDEMRDFLKNFVSIVVRRENMSSYLENKSAEFHEMAEDKQKNLLNRLGILAEFYVVVFVAAPLFLITILVVMGFVGESTLVSLRAVIYLLVPLSGVAYIIILDMMFESPVLQSQEELHEEGGDFLENIPVDDSEPDEETKEKIRLLETYEVRKKLENYIRSPIQTLRTNPRASLYVGVSVGLLYLLGKASIYIFYLGGDLPNIGALTSGHFDLVLSDSVENSLRAVDDSLIEALMISLIFYAVFYQIRFEYLKKVENELPEFLSRLANVNQAGIPISQSLASLDDAELGVLNTDVQKMARDIRWNSTAVEALQRFDQRVQSPAITRASVLLTKTSETSGRIARVLETAARDADLRRRLNVERRSEMSLYLVVIYISFMVFIVIVTILSAVFIPAIPQENVGDIPQLAGGGFEAAEYETLFYHASVIQGLFSGLIAGKMSSGRASVGVKHAFIMIAVAYVTFTFFLPLL